MQRNPQVPHIYAPAAKNRSRGPVDSAADTRELDTMSTTKTMKITGLAALALVATLAFTGCSGKVAAPTAASTATSAASSGTAATTPAPTTTAAPIKSGDALTPEQIKSLPQTVRAYTLPDGSQIATVQGEALPAPVVADITVKAQTASGGEFNGSGTAAERSATADAMKAAVKDAGVATGRLVVAVFPVYGYRTATSGLSHYWTTSRFDAHFFDTAEEAKADVEQTYADNPARVQIVVLTK
jgi:hypothetical protein